MKRAARATLGPAFTLLSLVLGAAALLAAAPAALAQAAAPAAGAAALDIDKLPAVVAKVNGIEIKKSELMTQAAIVRAQIRRAGGKDPGANPELFKRILSGLVGEALIFDDAKKKGMLATEAEIDKKLEGFRLNYPDQASFEAGLKEQGTSLEQVRAQLRQSLTIEKALRAEMNQKAKISDAEARAFYDANLAAFSSEPQVKVRLVRVRIEKQGDSMSREVARQKIEAARRKLVEGVAFADVVKQYSDDPLTKDKAGVLPPFTLGNGPVDAAIAKLQPNQLSQAIEFSGAFQIIELMERIPPRTIGFEEARKRIDGLLEQGKLQEAVLAKVDALRKNAKIETAF